MMTVKVWQALKAKEEIQHEPSLKRVRIPEGSEEEILKSFNYSISGQLTKIKTVQQRETTMADVCAAMDKAARDDLQLTEPQRKRASCHPGLPPPIEARLQAIKNYDYEGMKSITKYLTRKQDK